MKPVKNFKKINGTKVDMTRIEPGCELIISTQHSNSFWLADDSDFNSTKKNRNYVYYCVLHWDTNILEIRLVRKGAGTNGTTAITTTIGPKECASPARFAEAIGFTLERMRDTPLWEKYIDSKS